LFAPCPRARRFFFSRTGSAVVTRLGAQCVVDFTSECGEDEADLVEHYSDAWMGAIIALLSGGSLPQQCAAIPAVSAMAGALQARFARFYAPLLPSFLSILASATGPEARSLRGPAMECISW
jgi:hypothetical protein